MTTFFEIRISPKQLIAKYKAAMPEQELEKLNYQIKKLFMKIVKFYECEKYICCFEKQNKFGEDLSLVDKEHFHFRFETDYKRSKPSVQKWIKENAHFKLAGTGNQCFAISSYPDVESFNDWWGYCCKENPIFEDSAGFSKTEFENMTIAAKAIRTRSIAANLERRSKSHAKATLYSKIKIYLDTFTFKGYCDQNVHKIIFHKIVEYYIKNNIELNPSSISSKSYRYMLDVKFITIDEYYNITILHNA